MRGPEWCVFRLPCKQGVYVGIWVVYNITILCSIRLAAIRAQVFLENGSKDISQLQQLSEVCTYVCTHWMDVHINHNIRL